MFKQLTGSSFEVVGKVVLTPIFDIRFSETGAIVDLISVKGNESIQIGYSYEEAVRIFASNFRNSAYCRQISMSDLEFEKINGVIVVKNSVYAETFDVIAIVDNQIYAANESGFALIKANNILDQIKIGNKIVTCFRDDNGTPIYKVGTGTNSEDAILTDLPLRNVKINRNLMESLTENDGAAVTGIKVVPMDHDLSRVSISFKDRDVRVKGIDKDRSKIEIIDPVIKFNSNGELFVCGLDSMENICQYRIIGTAFGEFDNLLARVSC